MNQGLGLRRWRGLSCYVQVLLAGAGVLSAGAGSNLGFLGLIAVFGYCARAERKGHFRGADLAGSEEVTRPGSWLWTGSFLLALGLSLTRAYLWRDILDAGVDFLFFAAAQRALDPNIRPARRSAQLLLVGVVMMMIAAVINTELYFPAMLAVFLGISILALQLNAALAVVEENGATALARVERASRRHLAHILRSAIRMTVFSGLCGAMVFLFFPRFGIGAFLRGSLPTRTTSGFADEVQLGHFGNIQNDQRIVMHLRDLKLPSSPITSLPRPELSVHLRATAFDHYTKGRWSHSKAALPSPLIRAGGYHIRRRSNPRVKPSDLADLHMEVILNDIGTDLLFAASHVVGINLRTRGIIEGRSRVVGGVDDQYRVLDRAPGAIQYEFLARITPPKRALLAAVGLPDERERAHLSAYLQVPGELQGELDTLAKAWRGDANSRLEVVEALIRAFQKFEYTTDAQPSARMQAGDDPILGFLFETKAGHCEYFSTGLTLLLRQLGVPARNVNGYHGAHYNERGGFYVVRQTNAHSWTEVYFPEHGWLTFDATPPDGRTPTPENGLLAQSRAVFEALQDQYLRYVIDYDLRKQLDMLSTAGVDLRRGPGRFSFDRPRMAKIAIFVFALFALAYLAYRVRQRDTRPDAGLRRGYERLLEALIGLGWRVDPSESAPRLARRLGPRLEATGHQEQAKRLAQLCAEYSALRFRAPNAPDTGTRLAACSQGLNALAKNLRQVEKRSAHDRP